MNFISGLYTYMMGKDGCPIKSCPTPNPDNVSDANAYFRCQPVAGLDYYDVALRGNESSKRWSVYYKANSLYPVPCNVIEIKKRMQGHFDGRAEVGTVNYLVLTGGSGYRWAVAITKLPPSLDSRSRDYGRFL